MPAGESAATTFDTDHDNVFPDDTRTDRMNDGAGPRPAGRRLPATSRRRVSIDDDDNLEAYVSSEVSLHDHLTEQLGVAITDPVERIVGAAS